MSTEYITNTVDSVPSQPYDKCTEIRCPGIIRVDNVNPRRISMARKQTKEAPVPATETVEEAKAVRLDLPIAMHRELRLEAARREQSMAALVRGLVEEFLARRKAANK
jgi:hypothetical protein